MSRTMDDKLSGFKKHVDEKLDTAMAEQNVCIGKTEADIAELRRTVAADMQTLMAMGKKGNPTGGGNPDTVGKYWFSRRCLRFRPIAGPTVTDRWNQIGDFIHDYMLIPEDEIGPDSIEEVRKTANTRKPKIRDEVLVVFGTVAARDTVLSYARNLATQRELETRPSIRMEIPDHLVWPCAEEKAR